MRAFMKFAMVLTIFENDDFVPFNLSKFPHIIEIMND